VIRSAQSAAMRLVIGRTVTPLSRALESRLCATHRCPTCGRCASYAYAVAGDLSASDEVVWRALVDKRRAVWRRLSAQTLAQAEVTAPDGTIYLVRISRNEPIKGGGRNVGDLGSAIELAVENIRTAGATGWSISVLKPPTPFRAPRQLFRQKVHAQAIVVDIAFVIVEAIQRGDRLWDED
jgi:hypothetical protein